jgi:hypothetical protein
VGFVIFVTLPSPKHMAQVMIATFLVVFLYSFPCKAQVEPLAKKAIFDARQYDFTSHDPLKLNGEWEFYWNELVDIGVPTTNVAYVNFPHVWNTQNAQGYATYRVKILVSRNTSTLALGVPELYCAYTLWINGTLIAKNGIVSTTRKDSQAQWLPQTKVFAVTSDTLDLTMQISNFQHSIGGIKNPIYIGMPAVLLAKQHTSYWINSILLGVLGFIGVFFLNVYFFVKREKSVLYFSMLCLTWALRSIFSEQYLAIHWMPWFDWELGVKIEYITLYLEMAWAVLFIGNLYPLDTNKIVKRILLYPNYAFVFLTMATPALLYTQLLKVYLLLAGLLILYTFFVIMRAMVFERYGAWFSVFGLISVAASFGYNFLSYQGLFDFYPIAFYSSYLVFFSFLAIALLYQLSPKAGERNYTESLSFDDLMKK